MHITHLTIEDLRPISRLDLDLAVGGAPRRRVILLGINGAGKTTTLEAVAYAFQRLQPIGDHDPLLRPSDVRRRPEGIEPTETPVAVVSLDTVLSSEEHATARETQPSAPRSGTLRFELGTRRSAPGREGGPTATVQDLLDAGLLGSRASGGWHGTAAAASLLASKAPCVYLPADRGVLTYRDDLPLAEVVRFDAREGALTKDRRRFGALAARLALAFSGNKSLDEAGALSRMWKVLARYLPELPRPVAVDGVMLMFQTQARVLVRLTDLSEGERAVLLLFAELATRLSEDGIALIDELEQHLHVRWQRAVLDALTAMMPSAQVIVTSQSPYLAVNASDDIVKLGEWDQTHV
jgi:hypothetical protein